MAVEQEDSRIRCAWSLKSSAERLYHDTEWGVPLHDDRRLFEFLILDAMQAGLSWRTVLLKREAFREVFDNFDAERVARYDEHKINALLADSRIIRNTLKIRGAVRNAQKFLEVQRQFGSFDAYIWQFCGGKPIVNAWPSITAVPAKTAESDAMSKDMKKRGFTFVGSTICYAFMQAAGMVNDHTTDCFRYAELAG